MKKTIILFVVVFIVISKPLLVSCGGSEQANENLMEEVYDAQKSEEHNAVVTHHEEENSAEEFIIWGITYIFDAQDIEKNGITIQTEHGLYDFLPGEWTVDILKNHVSIIDSSIAYVYDWFDVKQNNPVPIELDPWESERFGGFGSYEGVRIFGALSLRVCAVTHEIVHYIQFTDDLLVSDGFVPIYLVEGLAEAVVYSRMADEEAFRSKIPEGELFRNIDMWPLLGGLFAQLPHIEIFSDGEIETMSLSKMQAILFIADMYESQSVPSLAYGGLFSSGSGLGNPKERFDGFLYTYATATTFSLFLLEFGGLDAYISFYKDYRSAEEIYGVDLTTLVNMWLYDYLQYDKVVPQIIEIWDVARTE
jgi:hypothetical protein